MFFVIHSTSSVHYFKVYVGSLQKRPNRVCIVCDVMLCKDAKILLLLLP